MPQQVAPRPPQPAQAPSPAQVPADNAVTMAILQMAKQLRRMAEDDRIDPLAAMEVSRALSECNYALADSIVRRIKRAAPR